VGYHESVAGNLDRHILDRFVPDVPVRIQHRSGALWVLNGAALEAIGLDSSAEIPGVERDTYGRPNGRLFRLDAWLRKRIPEEVPPDLAPVDRLLVKSGTTGVTDATEHNDVGEMQLFARALVEGVLRVRVVAMGRRELRLTDLNIPASPVKILLDERALPDPESLSEAFRSAHEAGRSVAIHCVGRVEAVLALAMLRQAGSMPGDRIEHCAVAPPEVVEMLVATGVTVVTQPNFVRERGDQYLQEVGARDLPWLYRCAGLDAAGIPVGGGTDAPFGVPNPWLAMQAAVDRRTEAGSVLGEQEGVTPERALALFTTSPEAPGGLPRRVVPGSPADLCLLSLPWQRARDRLDAADVAATIIGGRGGWQRG